MKEYPVTIVKPGVFLVFLGIYSFLAFKVLVRILLESPKGGFKQVIPSIYKRVGFVINRVFYLNVRLIRLIVKQAIGNGQPPERNRYEAR